MLGRLSHYRQMISAVGLRAGTELAIKRAVSRTHSIGKGRNIERIRLKGVKNPISLRVGTSDYLVLKQIFVDREYHDPSRQHSERIQIFYDAILRDGKNPLILDCGANIGLASVWYAAQYPRSVIVAVEPEQENFALLEMNSSSSKNILAINAGISNRNHNMALSNVSDQPWAWETSASSTGDIAAITVKDALLCVPNSVPFIAKIDIEGFEVELFQSDYAWVNQFPLIVFEHHDWLFPWRGTAHAFFRALTELGPRDYLQRGENVFSYSHALLKPPSAR